MKLLVVQPGPVVVLYDDGVEITRVELTFDATRHLLRGLLKEMPYGPDAGRKNQGNGEESP